MLVYGRLRTKLNERNKFLIAENIFGLQDFLSSLCMGRDNLCHVYLLNFITNEGEKYLLFDKQV